MPKNDKFFHDFFFKSKKIPLNFDKTQCGADDYRILLQPKAFYIDRLKIDDISLKNNKKSAYGSQTSEPHNPILQQISQIYITPEPSIDFNDSNPD